jgi:hypothetical protein
MCVRKQRQLQHEEGCDQHTLQQGKLRSHAGLVLLAHAARLQWLAGSSGTCKADTCSTTKTIICLLPC